MYTAIGMGLLLLILPAATLGIGVGTLAYLLPRLGYGYIETRRALVITALGLIAGGFIGSWTSDVVVNYMFLSSWPAPPRQIAAYLLTLAILFAWSHCIYNRFLHTQPRDTLIIVAVQSALVTLAFLLIAAGYGWLSGLDE